MSISRSHFFRVATMPMMMGAIGNKNPPLERRANATHQSDVRASPSLGSDFADRELNVIQIPVESTTPMMTFFMSTSFLAAPRAMVSDRPLGALLG